MIGPLLVVIGVGLIWVAARGKSEPVLGVFDATAWARNLETFLSNIPIIGSAFGGARSTNLPATSTGGLIHDVNQAADIGVHMGLDASGNIITIAKTYAQMTQHERDEANAFAHRFPNGMAR